jgi:hypothetical protein
VIPSRLVAATLLRLPKPEIATKEVIGSCSFEVIEFTGGLYEASVSIADNDGEGERVYAEIKKGILTSGYFSIDENGERQTLFHVITSDAAYTKMNHRQIDISVPIKATVPG